MESILLGKLLHQLIERFLTLVERNSHYKKVDDRKLFAETVRRRKVVGEQIYALAFEIHEKFKVNGIPMSRDDVDIKIENILSALMQADFFESAVNADKAKYDTPYEDFIGGVRNSLYLCALEAHLPSQISQETADLNLLTSMISSSIIRDETESRLEHLFTAEADSYFLESPIAFQCESTNLGSLSNLPSLQFETMHLDLENEINLSKRMWNQFLKKSEVGHITRDNENVTLPTQEEAVVFTPVDQWREGDTEALFCDAQIPAASWESCVRHSVRDARYGSDLLDSEVPSLIHHCPEWRAFHDLYTPNGLVEHGTLLLSSLDMLIGLPSTIFPYNKIEKKFHIKPGAHLSSISHEATKRFFTEAICAGSMFCRLEEFAEEEISIGFVMNGLKHGVKQILSTFKEYIISFKSSSLEFSDLHKSVMKNAQLIIYLAEICGISPQFKGTTPLPQGSGLLPYLKRSAWVHKTKENSVMVAVLMKNVFSPCLRFMNRWMIEGIYEDTYGEFFIQANETFIHSRDNSFWTKAFVLRNSNQESIHNDDQVLNCGKSIMLLKLCCPEHPTLHYMEKNPPPLFSMTFSFKASKVKAERCMTYMREMESAVSQRDEKSQEFRLVLSQKLLSFEEMRAKVQDRWLLLSQASRNKKNVLSRGALNTSYGHLQTPDININNRNVLIQHQSECDLLVKEDNHDRNFSGALCGKAGIIFSTCGFELKQNGLLDDKEGTTSVSGDRIIDWLPLDNITELTLHLSKTQSWSSSRHNTDDSPLSSGSKHLSCFGMTLKSPRYVEDSGFRFLKAFGRNGLNSCSSRGSMLSIGESGHQISIVHDFVPGPFIRKLSSLLCDKEFDEEEADVYACVQMTNMTNVIFNSLSPVLMLQTSLTQKIIIDYIVDQLALGDLLLTLRNVYFFQDEGFSQSFCEQIFQLVTDCKAINQFCCYSNLSDILSNALADSTHAVLKETDSVRANLQFFPDTLPEIKGKLLQFVRLDFTVDWPHNIIVPQICIEKYNRVFSMLLYIEYISWILGKAWGILKLASRQNSRLSLSIEFRKIMIVRRHMEHHARSMRKSIHYELHSIVNTQLDTLYTSASSVDSLIAAHAKYLDSSIERCFLSPETRPFYDLFEVISHLILKFCSDVLKIDPQTGEIDDELLSSLNVTSCIYYKNAAEKHSAVTSVKKQWTGPSWDYKFEDYLLTSFG